MSVAIRTATRLQDQDDFGSTPGAGNDGYALTWDNDAGEFVLAAAGGGVTDHGALTGLSDDDHSQYLLATGARTGATSQAQAFTNGVVLPNSSNVQSKTTGGVAYTMIGSYSDDNLYIGSPAQIGDTIFRSGAGEVVRLTSGKCVGIGVAAPEGPLHIVANDATTFVQATDAAQYSGMSMRNHLGNLAASFQYGNSSAGAFANCMFLGTRIANADFILVSGSGTNERVRLKSDGLFGIGTSSPGSLLHCLLTSAATNAVPTVLTIGHDTSGTAAAGFGAGMLFNLESSTTAAQNAARIQALWYEATHATRKADLVLTAYDTSEREGLRIRGAGSEPSIGFYGVAPIARAILATGAGASVDDVITALQNLGLVKQS